MKILNKGSCGNCTWTIDEDFVLRISPADFSPRWPAGTLCCEPSKPWHAYRNGIKKVVVDEGVIADRDMEGMFSYMAGCVSFEIGKMDVSRTVIMDRMFEGCVSLEDVGSLGSWDVRALETARTMFAGCTSLKNISTLSSWDTGSLFFMSYMFADCKNLADISPLKNWDVSRVRDISYAFSDCTSLEDAKAIEAWEPANLLTAEGMFEDTLVKKHPLDRKIPMACPRSGSFVGYKKCCGEKIVKLKIPADAARSSALGKKCRCSKAVVLEIRDMNGKKVNEAASYHDRAFVYREGETVEIKNFDDDRFEECASGIHFFMKYEDAKAYVY